MRDAAGCNEIAIALKTPTMSVTALQQLTARVR